MGVIGIIAPITLIAPIKIPSQTPKEPTRQILLHHQIADNGKVIRRIVAILALVLGHGVILDADALAHEDKVDAAIGGTLEVTTTEVGVV